MPRNTPSAAKVKRRRWRSGIRCANTKTFFVSIRIRTFTTSPPTWRVSNEDAQNFGFCRWHRFVLMLDSGAKSRSGAIAQTTRGLLADIRRRLLREALQRLDAN